MKINSFFAAAVLLLAACSAKQSTITPTDNRNSFSNPVFAHDFPDPNIVKGKDGYVYAYSTEADWTRDGIAGGRRIIPILRSKNLVSWETVGAALASRPSWKPEGGIWAPDVTEVNGKYFLYYSFSTWGDPNPGIGFAVSDKPEGPFTDKGKLFFSKEVGVDNSIDPYLVVENGKLFLFWGSFHGIFGIPLSDDGTKVTGEKFQVAGTAYEGSCIFKRGSYYYYLGSTGSCCEGEKSTYQVKVGRADALQGPYVDRNGKPLLENGGTVLLHRNEGSDGFVGTGHNADLVQDDAGVDWLLYHAFENKQGANKRIMLLDKITWENDWPVIKNNTPALGPQSAPYFK